MESDATDSNNLSAHPKWIPALCRRFFVGSLEPQDKFHKVGRVVGIILAILYVALNSYECFAPGQWLFLREILFAPTAIVGTITILAFSGSIRFKSGRALILVAILMAIVCSSVMGLRKDGLIGIAEGLSDLAFTALVFMIANKISRPK